MIIAKCTFFPKTPSPPQQHNFAWIFLRDDTVTREGHGRNGELREENGELNETYETNETEDFQKLILHSPLFSILHSSLPLLEMHGIITVPCPWGRCLGRMSNGDDCHGEDVLGNVEDFSCRVETVGTRMGPQLHRP